MEDLHAKNAITLPTFFQLSAALASQPWKPTYRRPRAKITAPTTR